VLYSAIVQVVYSLGADIVHHKIDLYLLVRQMERQDSETALAARGSGVLNYIMDSTHGNSFYRTWPFRIYMVSVHLKESIWCLDKNQLGSVFIISLVFYLSYRIVRTNGRCIESWYVEEWKPRGNHLTHIYEQTYVRTTNGWQDQHQQP